MTRTLETLISLDRLHCHLEGDGFGEGEPYLWTAFFKIDGDTLEVDVRSPDDPLVHEHPFFLNGGCTFVTTPGSHDNLSVTGVGSGNDVTIPAGVGRQTFTLKPIPRSSRLPNGDPESGAIGVIVALMEENRTSDSAADAGHAAFNTTLEQGINEIIPTLTPEQRDPTPEQIAALKEKIRDAVSDAFKRSKWYDHDVAIDVAFFVAGEAELLERPVKISRRLQRRVTSPRTNREIVVQDYELFGELIALGPSRLHVLALHDGRLAHTLRPETGSWAGWGDVFSGGGTGELANITHIAAAGTASGLHVLALHDGRLAHTLRPETGSWAGWGDVFSGGGTGELANITHIAAAGTASGLHVLALHDGRLAHTLRPETGSWAGWGDVFSGGGTGELANITHIAAAGTASGLHVLALHDGRLAHTLRPETGSWAGWGDVFSGGGTGELANITHIAAAGTASGLHVLALHDGRLAHTLRPETGSWAGWGDVFSGGGTGELANITHIAAAG